MFGRFLPRSDAFFDYFEKHASFVVEAAQLLNSLVNEDSESTAGRANQIHILEHTADANAHQCIELLHKTFITPFERDDIYKLIVEMDDIIDLVEAAAERIVLYRLHEKTQEVKVMTTILVNASQEIESIVKGLRTKQSVDELRPRLTAVHQLEHDGDDIYRKAVGRLFDEEKDTRLLIKWKEVYETLENSIDCCVDVVNTIEGVILERD